MDQEANGVWQRTLREIKRARTRRRCVRAGVAAGLAVWCGITFTHLRVKDAGQAQVVARPRMEPAAPTWAVFVWRDGQPSLQALEPDDLSGTELSFSLEPVVAATKPRADAGEDPRFY